MKDERARVTMQTTVLVNEVYLRLVDTKNIEWQHRAQFFSICAQMMRRIFVDGARARGALKGGGGGVAGDIELAAPLAPGNGTENLALHEDLAEFAKSAPGQ